jgi:hypothetical protein
MNETYEPVLYDTEYGTVISHTNKYISIRLDTGLEVRAFHGAAVGSRLMVSLKRLGDPSRGWLPLAIVESVNFEKGGDAA